ncbi:MAG: hypothetical protein Q7Q71_15310 [Verrucomicrobiota bacterium JB023]|nr:hypothetical protein [Verrucomicrobiota bacterium JB023]
MKKNPLIINTLGLLAGVTSSQGAIIAGYDFDTGDDVPTTEVTVRDPFVDVSSFGVGAGLIDFINSNNANSLSEDTDAEGNVFGTANPHSYGSAQSNFGFEDMDDADDLPGAMTAEDYMTFTVTPLEGQSMSFSKFTFRTKANNLGNAAERWALFSSIDGFEVENAIEIGETTEAGQWTNVVIDLSASQFQGVSLPVEFRLYIYGGNAPWSSATTFDKVILDGVVSSDAEPDSDNDGLLDAWENLKAGNLTDLSGLGEADFDNDGLTDLEEFDLAVTNQVYLNIDPTLADTDADGVDDGVEVNDRGSDPTDQDSDDDGLLDNVETKTGIYVDENDTGSDPTLADTDSDGLDDLIETYISFFGYNPNVDDSESDFDDDGATVAQEIAMGTDVTLEDTDSDGYYDGAETNTGTFVSYDFSTNRGDTGTNPLEADTDGDSIRDGAETATGTYVDEDDTGTDPNSADTDNDGFDDYYDSLYGGDPSVAENSLPNAVSGYTATGGDWLSLGLFDIDGDGSLGTDGFIFFGDFTGIQINGQPYTHQVVSDPLPSYLEFHGPGVDFVAAASGYNGYGEIDDPNLLDGTDQRSGFGLATGGSAGAVTELMTFDISNLTPGQVVRVGILGGVSPSADGRWDPTALFLRSSNGYDKAGLGLEANPGGVQAGWLFFEITENGTYTISGAQRLNSQGSSVAGITFDSVASAADADPDTDSDGLPDGWEMATAGNLTDLSGLSEADFDNDGLSDAEELLLAQGDYQNLSPVLADTDGDGKNDAAELNSNPPTDPTVFDEFVFEDLVLAVANANGGADLVFTWNSIPGNTYDILRGTDLSVDPTTWTVWQADIAADASGLNTETFTRPEDETSFFILIEK